MKTILLFAAIALTAAAYGDSYPAPVLPPEHKQVTDPATGAALNFLTTAPGKDFNTYIYQQEWLQDGSLILFNSDRNKGGVMGYLTQTGELVKFESTNGVLTVPVASVHRPVFFARRGPEIIETSLRLDISEKPEARPSLVTAQERMIARIEDGNAVSFITESPDGNKLAMGVDNLSGEHKSAIMIYDIATGEATEACGWPEPAGFRYHVQWSWTDPNLILFAGYEDRLYAVDIRDKKPRCLYDQRPEEVVTHEVAWVDNQILFCGGTHPVPTEDGHVKVMDLASGVIRIIGAGAWWTNAAPAELAKVNWWHCSGSRDGRWAAADNWHGDIMLFEARTTRPRLLTANHRKYGQGEHPHVSWDQAGKALAFTSEILGNPDVCVATIPAEWQAVNP